MNDSADPPLPKSVQPVLSALERAGVPYDMQAFTSPARRAAEAAALIGCPLGAIVKSLIFTTSQTAEMALVLVSGANWADEARLQAIVHQCIKPASPGEVLARTGYPIGAVPPLGHKSAFPVLMDADLMGYDQAWASAGAAHVVFGIAPHDLQALCKAKVIEVKA